MTDVRVDVVSVQKADGEKTEFKYKVSGKYSFSEDKITLRYIEPEETGLGRVSTHLHLGGGCVTVRRFGDIKCEIKMEKGGPSEFRYRTPVGEMDMSAGLKFLGSSLSEKGGRLCLRYEMYLAGEKVSENELNITICEI